jgi:hypothetical protein
MHGEPAVCEDADFVERGGYFKALVEDMRAAANYLEQAYGHPEATPSKRRRGVPRRLCADPLSP